MRMRMFLLAGIAACCFLVEDARAQSPAWGDCIMSVTLEQDGTLVVTHREQSPIVTLQYCPGGCPPPPPHWWREVFGVKDGRIVLLRAVEAKVTPAQPAQVEWPE